MSYVLVWVFHLWVNPSRLKQLMLYMLICKIKPTKLSVVVKNYGLDLYSNFIAIYSAFHRTHTSVVPHSTQILAFKLT